MSLITILVYAVALLTFLSGLSVMLGAAKADRVRMTWFLLAAISAAIWGVFCAAFLRLPETADVAVPFVLGGIYIGGTVLTLTLLGYTSWDTLYGKILVVLYLVYTVAMSTLVINNPSLFFVGYTLGTTGNSVELVNGWAYWSYILSFGAISLVVWLSTLMHSRRARLKRIKQGDAVLLVGFMFTGVLAGLFNIFLPLTGFYSMIWAGPLAVGVTMILFYYALLKFRIVSVSSTWLKVTSLIALIGAGVIVYMLLFYLVFTALFKIPNPSASVLVLNFLMIVIVLLLMPVLSELWASVRSMISVGQVDIAYVIRKLNHLATRNIDLRDLAGFLADHLHFAYVGFIINGRLYGSKALAMSSEEISQITHLKQTPRDLWQEPTKSVQKTFDELGLKAVAELRNAKGKTYGQLIVGKPLGKAGFERRDLLQLEMIINLVATVIDSEKHLRA